MTFSTIVAIGFVIAFVCVVVFTLGSLLTGGSATRRGSGRPGIPRSSDSGMSGGYWGDGGGSSGDGGGGGCGGGGGGGD